MNQRGLTLVEALVTMAILLGVMLASLALFQAPLVAQKNINVQTNFSLIRSNVLNVLRSSGGWEQTTRGASNQSIFKCFFKQDSIVDSDRDCPLAAQSLDVYDNKGTLIYEFRKPDFGFKMDGTPCTGFQATPPGNPLCPLRVDLTAQALCSASPCENPDVQVTGDFTYNSPESLPLNLKLFHFKFLSGAFYCPPQVLPGLVAQGSDVAISGTQVMANVSGKVAVTGSAHYSSRLLPCRSVQFNFNYSLGASDLDADGTPDTEGIAQVCLVHPTLGCLFAVQIRPGGPTFDILYQGAVVATKPAAFTLLSSSTLGFKIYNGRVDVCFDGKCFFSFSQKLGAPFDVQYRPASTSYSTGFTNVTPPVFSSL